MTPERVQRALLGAWSLRTRLSSWSMWVHYPPKASVSDEIDHEAKCRSALEETANALGYRLVPHAFEIEESDNA